jgi:hypothetical protein
MDISALDDQVVDIATAWFNGCRSGHNVHASFDYGSYILAEPAATAALAIADAIAVNGYAVDPFQDLLRDVPSENLKLLVETFQRGRENGDLLDQMRKLIDTLWERHRPETQSALTTYKDIGEAMVVYGYDPDANIRAETRKKLLSLGNHLIPYVDCCITLGCAGPPDVATFLLLKILRTEGAIKILRRYAAQTYTHYPIASVVLEDLSLSYDQPSNADGTLYCWECNKALPLTEPVFRTHLHKEAVFCSQEHLNRNLPHLMDWFS